MSREPITTLAGLREHLQWAVELEHATLPPYLVALYSLDAERNPEAAEAVEGVFIEEMLHLALAANLLNAVGGRPELDKPGMLPPYPRTLPHGDPSLELSLLPFGPEALEMFLRLEQPAPADAPAQSDRYETIGQFYAAVETGLRHLCERYGERAVFSGDPARQLSGARFRHTAGEVFAVEDLDSALGALKEIVDQGEGASHGSVWDGDRSVFHPERDELAHYYRFEELKLGRRYRRGDTPRSGPTGEKVAVDPDGIRPLARNPRPAEPGSEVRAAQDRFDETYCELLRILEQTFNGEPGRLGEATGVMFELKAEAQALMRLTDEEGCAAGPTFTYLPRRER
ncbi:ferritin-like protein [Nonomuraea sp. NPDC050310]|uniref:ferritin-like domain-containing protein n=1 Tax=unclassified Nonomuraea TaxID=2593643 RepID=UPI0033FA81F2